MSRQLRRKKCFLSRLLILGRLQVAAYRFFFETALQLDTSSIPGPSPPQEYGRRHAFARGTSPIRSKTETRLLHRST
jgi:hypothetical protein